MQSSDRRGVSVAQERPERSGEPAEFWRNAGIYSCPARGRIGGLRPGRTNRGRSFNVMFWNLRESRKGWHGSSRGRRIAEGWRFADWLANGSTFCSSDRIGKGSTDGTVRAIPFGQEFKSPSLELLSPILLPNWANGDGISNEFLFRLLPIGGMRDCRWTVRRSPFRLELYVAFPSDMGFRKMVDNEPIYDTRA